jgi:hypothetical protein
MQHVHILRLHKKHYGNVRLRLFNRLVAKVHIPSLLTVLFTTVGISGYSVDGWFVNGDMVRTRKEAMVN